MKTNYIKIWTIIFALSITTFAFSQEDDENYEEIEQLSGTFNGYNEELDNFLFIVIFEEDGSDIIENYNFIFSDDKIKSKYDLKSDKLIGENFLIKYTVKVVSEALEDGSEDFYEIYTIKDLTLIK